MCVVLFVVIVAAGVTAIQELDSCSYDVDDDDNDKTVRVEGDEWVGEGVSYKRENINITFCREVFRWTDRQTGLLIG